VTLVGGGGGIFEIRRDGEVLWDARNLLLSLNGSGRHWKDSRGLKGGAEPCETGELALAPA